MIGLDEALKAFRFWDTRLALLRECRRWIDVMSNVLCLMGCMSDARVCI
jgi:hypothetical protein